MRRDTFATDLWNGALGVLASIPCFITSLVAAPRDRTEARSASEHRMFDGHVVMIFSGVAEPTNGLSRCQILQLSALEEHGGRRRAKCARKQTEHVQIRSGMLLHPGASAITKVNALMQKLDFMTSGCTRRVLVVKTIHA